MDEALLAGQRQRIDAIDAAIVGLLAERMGVVREVVALKHAHGIAARLNGRVETVVGNVRAEAEAKGCPPDLAEAVWRTVIEWTIAYEDDILAAGSLE